jgi:cytochrome c
MDSFELNKIAGAVLGTMLVVFGISIVGDMIFHAEEPEEPAYIIAVATEPTEPGEEPTAEAEAAIATLLASGDPEAGQAAARPCGACHTFEEGGANRVGPNLWDTVEQPIANAEGFNYSNAMQEHAQAHETWSYELLDAFLASPRDAVPGTTMGFAGVRDPQQRANLIAYMRELSADPAPLPQPPAETPQPAAGTAGPSPEPAAEEAAEPQQQAQAEQTGEEAEAQPPAEAPAEAEAPPPAEAEAQPAAEAPAEGEADLPPALAMMAEVDIAAGQAEARKCQACHALEEGGGNRVGPPLWGIVDDPIAEAEGFNFSPALQEFGEGRVWDFATLDAFIADPRGTVPGNRMAFPGIRDDRARAALLVYLNSLSNEPAPLPGAQ